MDDRACGIGTAAAIKGETQPEVVPLRRLAFGREDAQQRKGAVTAVLLFLVTQREIQRRPHLAVISGNSAVGIWCDDRGARRRLPRGLKKNRGGSDEHKAAHNPSTSTKGPAFHGGGDHTTPYWNPKKRGCSVSSHKVDFRWYNPPSFGGLFSLAAANPTQQNG